MPHTHYKSERNTAKERIIEREVRKLELAQQAARDKANADKKEGR